MRHVWLFFILTLLLVGCSCGGLTQNLDAEPPNIELRTHDREQYREFMTHVSNRTVSVHYDCTAKKNVIIVGVDEPDKAFDSRGSGTVIISRDSGSYIYTAAHVVADINKKYKKGFTCRIFIYRNKDIGVKAKQVDAKILAINTSRDIAVLAVDEDLGFASNIELNVFVGEPVWIAGYPLQPTAPRMEVLSITSGEIATLNIPKRGNAGKHGYYHRATAPAYFGNSGGGTWNLEGSLVGVFVSLFTHEKIVPFDGYYYVKPVSEYEDLLRKDHKYWEVFGYPGKKTIHIDVL